jgi:hypothetical protein
LPSARLVAVLVGNGNIYHRIFIDRRGTSRRRTHSSIRLHVQAYRVFRFLWVTAQRTTEYDKAFVPFRPHSSETRKPCRNVRGGSDRETGQIREKVKEDEDRIGIADAKRGSWRQARRRGSI